MSDNTSEEPSDGANVVRYSPSGRDGLFKEVFDRINNLEKSQSETNGYLKAVVESSQKQIEQNKELMELSKQQNEKYVNLVWRVIIILSTFIVLLICAVIYGAIGKDGMKSVRETVPLMPKVAWTGMSGDKMISIACGRIDPIVTV